MRTVIGFLLAVLVFALSYCTRHIDPPKKVEPPKGWWRVAAIGSDTSYTNMKNGRTETTGVIAEDGYLKVKLKSYDYVNKRYIVEVTNKQSCQADFQVKGDNNIKPTKVTPNRKNDPLNSWVKANSTETFYIDGLPAIGKLQFKALSICNWCGEEPKWLTITVTEGVLPVVYTEYTVEKKEDYYLISWSIETAADTDHFLVEWSATGDIKTFLLKSLVVCDRVTKKYSAKIYFDQLLPKS